MAVLIAELATTGLSFLNHANAALPSWLEKPLRLVIITPGIHRIHHSEEMAEQNRNLGEIFPWWDRIFGTYQETAVAGPDIVTGVKGYREAASLGILFMLLHPFRMPREELMAPETKSGGAAAA
jgi:sterol desaturase/sphingolipid hydroxylase (fatty acid hydroxylase superfamily)